MSSYVEENSRASSGRRRILQVVKTSEGADWAADQAAELVRMGLDVHVALPSRSGRTVQKWIDAGVAIHVAPTDFSVRSPWALRSNLARLRDLVNSVKPDLIHSHFVSSTILLRKALGKAHSIPRLFQVPGPLHLEHRFWRGLEISSAGPADSWIASSRCILSHYRHAGIPEEKLFLSYYGTRIVGCPTQRSGLLRKKFGIPDHMKIVGNANFIYPPKWYLGQRVGLKAHEDIIDALGILIRQRSDVMGVLIGGTFKGSQGYERSLRARAERVGGGRILMAGYLPMDAIRQMWPDFDVAVHVPISENCGGVIEPILSGVPTIAGEVGGLPELMINNQTGTTVPIRDPQKLAAQVLRVLDNPGHFRDLALRARSLVLEMFSVERTAKEIYDIYACVLHDRPGAPAHFDPQAFLAANPGEQDGSSSFDAQQLTPR